MNILESDSKADLFSYLGMTNPRQQELTPDEGEDQPILEYIFQTYTDVLIDVGICHDKPTISFVSTL